jgi:hypothetical protein
MVGLGLLGLLVLLAAVVALSILVFSNDSAAAVGTGRR